MHPATRGVTDAQGHPRVPFRAERALTAGLLCGPGGAAAHVLAGGAAPSAGLLAVVTLAALGGALAVLGPAGRRGLGWPVLLGLAGGAQLVFHHLLGTAEPTVAHAGHGQAPMTDMGGMAGHDATTMLLGHLAVAVLVAAVARGAESSWCAMARSALARLVPGLPVPAGNPVVVVRAPRPRATPAMARPENVVLEVVGPRGPPLRRASVTLAA